MLAEAIMSFSNKRYGERLAGASPAAFGALI